MLLVSQRIHVYLRTSAFSHFLLVMDTFIFLMRHFESKISSSTPACDAFITAILPITVRMNSLIAGTKSTGKPRSQRHPLKTVLSACRLEVVFTWLLWELACMHSYTLRTTVLTFYFIHNQQPDGLKMLFHKATLWDKSNSIFNIWSNYSLRGDYLWRGLSHSTVTGSWTCTGQKTSFFSCATFNKIPPARSVLLGGGTCESTKGGYLFIWPCYIQ